MRTLVPRSVFRSPWFAAALLAAAAVLGFGSQRFALGDDASGQPGGADTLAGAWFCAGPDGAASLVAATPPAAGGRPADLTVGPLGAPDPADEESTSLVPGAASTVGGDATWPVTVRWRSWPAVLTQLIRPDDGPRTLAEACMVNASSRWVVPGLVTADGATAEVALVNPFDTPAAVSLTLSGAGGTRDLLRLENVSVGPRSTTTVDLNEVAPAESDLSVFVATTAGRVVAQGVQRLDPEVGGVAGLSFVRAAREAATSWTLPWYESSEGAESWLWLTNPNETPAIATVVALTPSGPVESAQFGELTLEPGETRRFDLRDLHPGADGGVAVASDLPVVAASATRWTGEDVDRTGYDVQLGAPEAGKTWIGVVPGGTSRSTLVHVANAGERPAVVGVRLWAGAGIEQPPAWERITVPAGGVVTVDVGAETPPDLVDNPRTVTVVAEEGEVAVSLQASNREGPLDALLNLALSERDWQAPATAARPQLDLGLARSMRTAVAPSPSPSPSVAADDGDEG